MILTILPQLSNSIHVCEERREKKGGKKRGDRREERIEIGMRRSIHDRGREERGKRKEKNGERDDVLCKRRRGVWPTQWFCNDKTPSLRTPDRSVNDLYLERRVERGEWRERKEKKES